LNIGGRLWFARLVNFTAEAGCDFDTLLVHWSWHAETALDSLVVVECLLLTVGAQLGLVTVSIVIGSVPISSVVSGRVLLNDGAKTGIWSFDWAVHERQFSDVIFMDHTQYGPFLDAMDDGVLKLSLGDSVLLVKTIGGNELRGIVLWLAMQSIKWLWQSSGSQTID